MRDITAARYDSFEEADRADKEYYLKLTLAQRLKIQAELSALAYGYRDDPPPRLARVYRIIELPRS